MILHYKQSGVRLFKPLLFLIILLFVSGTSVAQQSCLDIRPVRNWNQSISLTAGHPITVGYNFLNGHSNNTNYDGIAGFGIDYSAIKINQFSFGIMVDAAFLEMNLSDVSLAVLSPKIKAEYAFIINRIQLIPQAGIGYSNWRFRQADMWVGTPPDEYLLRGHRDNYHGITGKLAGKFLFSMTQKAGLFLEFAYEFTRLGKNPDLLDIPYNRNLQIISPKIGVTWNFN